MNHSAAMVGLRLTAATIVLGTLADLFAEVTPAHMSCWIARELQLKQSNLTFVDVRSASAFAKERIIGAINMPLGKLEIHVFSRKDLLIVYCGNESCPLSAKAASTLFARGYGNVRVLQGGLAAWKKRGYPVEPRPHEERINRVLPGELLKALDSKRWRVLDVRPTMEFMAGHVPGAVGIPLEELPGKMPLPADREWVVYDRISERADKAALVLAKHGANVKVLVGGIAVWTAKGYPLEIGK